MVKNPIQHSAGGALWKVSIEYFEGFYYKKMKKKIKEFIIEERFFCG
jgi:hypothetical protein